MPIKPKKMAGDVIWTQPGKPRKIGYAEATLTVDGRLLMDVSDGDYEYRVVIEANDIGCWESGGEKGRCTGALSPSDYGYELHGMWYDLQDFPWRIEFEIVEQFTPRT